MQATGTFEVKLSPQAPEATEPTIARMLINKQFDGDLKGSSQGQMLAVRTAVEGSAGYVALERVTGSLAGRQGSFVLQHSSIMTRGVPQQQIRVVPDSGSEELTGLRGEMEIEIVAGEHRYRFDYAL